jgi:hypothetical protein
MMKVALLFFVAVTAAYALTRLVGNIPADCAPIAEQLASWELGNYAEPEDRAPVIERYKHRCDEASIGVDEAACLDKAKSKYAAAKCAPRLFPEIEVSNCVGVECFVERFRTTTDRTCACKTLDCSQKVMDEYTRWASDWAKQYAGDAASMQPDPEVTKDLNELATRMAGCMQRLAQPAGA